MKKVLVFTLVLVFALTLSLSAFAAPNNFYESPGRKPAPVLDLYENEDYECDAKLVITPYVERDTLNEEKRKALEGAYDQIISSNDLTTLTPDLAELVKSLKLNSSDISVSELFDISYYSCLEHDEHGRFKIILKVEKISNYVGIMHQKADGSWEVLESELLENGTKIRFYVDDLSPFAIIVSDVKIPGTSDRNNGALWTLLISAAALAVVVVVSVQLRRHEA